MHGDLRWANVLAVLDDVPPKLWLVDWELACQGDPAWDVGSVLADLLAAAAVRGLERGELPDVSFGARAFLASYRAAALTAGTEWPDFVSRSVALAGVRLVQALVKYGHYDVTYLSALEHVLLPRAAMLLENPEGIALELAPAATRPCCCGE